MAVTPAPVRLSRRTLSRQEGGMTPEQELALLIQEQADDDTYYVDRRGGEISLDAPVVSDDGKDSTVGAELVGYDPWPLVDACIDLGLDPAEVAYSGEIVSYLKPRRGEVLTDRSKIPHGTNGGYQNHRCRCQPCRNAYADWRREYRARRGQ